MNFQPSAIIHIPLEWSLKFKTFLRIGPCVLSFPVCLLAYGCSVSPLRDVPVERRTVGRGTRPVNQPFLWRSVITLIKLYNNRTGAAAGMTFICGWGRILSSLWGVPTTFSFSSPLGSKFPSRRDFSPKFKLTFIINLINSSVMGAGG